MIKVMTQGNEDSLVKVFQQRWKDSETLWSTIEKTYQSNLKIWKGLPDYLARIPQKRSKVRDNRIFMDMESQLNKLTARPIKPMVTPANGTADAKTIATNIQKYFLRKYTDLRVKNTVKRGLRYLHFSRLLSLKVFWDFDIDDFNVKCVDPRKIRISKTATSAKDSEFAIEKIDDKTLMHLIEQFPEKESMILSKVGKTRAQVEEENPTTEYYECWIGDGVFWVFRNEILEKMPHPYYDFKGILLTPEEKAQTEEMVNGAPRVNGQRRRAMFQGFKQNQPDRREEISKTPEAAGKYEAYLYNYHDKPQVPYITATVLEVEDKPIGETTLIEITNPLQEGVDKRKRQIDDNCEIVNGITKVDTDIVTMSLADARKTHYDPQGLVYGAGVSTGVSREFGQSLPDMVFKDLIDSRNELDQIFGTTGTFRGAQEKAESATGRAILREEAFSRLDEFVSVMDFVGQELYGWWLQFVRVRYTREHLTKVLGENDAEETIGLMQDDIQQGIEVKVQPGQSLPDDKLYRAERAKEDAQAGLIDPVTYLEQAGGYDNPQEIVKRAVMFKMAPLSVVSLNDDDIKKLGEALDLMGKFQMMAQGAAGGGAEGADREKATQMAAVRERIQQVTSSDKFKKLPPDQQKTVLAELRASLGGQAAGRV